MKSFKFYLLKSYKGWRWSWRKLFLNSLCIPRKVSISKRNLSKVASTTLLKSLSVMKDLKVFKEFDKNSFQHKNHHWKFVFQAYSWRRCVSGGGVALCYNCNTSSASQNVPSTNCLLSVRSKVNRGIRQQNILPSPIPLICLLGTKTNKDKCLQTGQSSLRLEMYHMMKWPSEWPEWPSTSSAWVTV